jgi:hypothetical protein
MGKDTPGYDPNDFDPDDCNWANTCMPLYQAKTAAKSLVNNLFQGYDQVAIVTFDYDAFTVFPLSPTIGDDDYDFDNDVYDAIDHAVVMHDDAPQQAGVYDPASRFQPPMNPVTLMTGMITMTPIPRCPARMR